MWKYTAEDELKDIKRRMDNYFNKDTGYQCTAYSDLATRKYELEMKILAHRIIAFSLNDLIYDTTQI